MNKLLIIFAFVTLAIIVKADIKDDMKKCTSETCNSDQRCVSDQESAINCYYDDCSKVSDDKLADCFNGCRSSLGATGKTNFDACRAKLSSSIISFSLLIVFAFFLMI